MKKKGKRVESEDLDLAPWLVSLARAIARDCPGPGEYDVSLSISPYRNRPVRLTIKKVDIIREQELDRKVIRVKIKGDRE